MIRVKRNPLWLAMLAALPLGAMAMLDPANRSAYVAMALLLPGMIAVFGGVFWLIRRAMGMDVPDAAVRELLDRTAAPPAGDVWILVRFRAKVSLEDARRQVGSASYSDADRLRGFMGKFEMIAPSRPDVAIYYGPKKGVLVGHRPTIHLMEERYGRWMLDNWGSLVGALRRHSLSVCDLDAPQMVVAERHVGSVRE